MTSRRKKILFTCCGVLALAVAAWLWPGFDKPPPPDAVGAEGFRFDQNQAVLTLRGFKSADMGMQIATRFATMDPPCRGMFATDTGDTNLVSKPIHGEHMGRLFKLYYLAETKEDGEYEMRIPMRVTHPECQWDLGEIEVKVRNSFSKGTGSVVRVDGSQFFHWSFLEMEWIAQNRAKPDRENFPEQVDAQCYNTTSTYGKGVICGAKGWRVDTFFPQSVAERNQTIILNLNLNPGIVDWDRLSERGVRPPWETVTGFK